MKPKQMHPGALGRPPELSRDRGAHEVLSGWIGSDGRSIVLLLPDAFDDVAVWGVLLADIAHHAANARAHMRGDDPANVLAQIRWAFEAEMNRPTDTATGRIEGPQR
jgi:hypothetical protein